MYQVLDKDTIKTEIQPYLPLFCFYFKYSYFCT